MGSRKQRTTSGAQTSTHPDRNSTQKKWKQQPQGRQVTSPANSSQNVHMTLPPEIQQSILNVFTQAFPVVSQQAEFRSLIQEVKGHLYNRDFVAAFGKQEYLDVYASRWSAARALVYIDIFTQPGHLKWFQPLTKASISIFPGLYAERNEYPSMKVDTNTNQTTETLTSNKESVLLSQVKSQPASARDGVTPTTESKAPGTAEARLKVVCIGGGAGAEIVALAAANRYLHSEANNASDRSNHLTALRPPFHMDVIAVDMADWSEQIRKISNALTSPVPPTGHVSQPTQISNRVLSEVRTDGQTAVHFKQEDVLQIKPDLLQKMLTGASVVTIMFTLNELFGTSLPKTTALLLNLTEAMAVDSHLIVVDSPGSYSEIKLGKSSQPGNDQPIKRYPMRWLLDHTLLEVARAEKEARWTKVEDVDSRWFRIDEKLGLRYGIDLENCRYQIHTFQKLR